jgi:hypothetical protein
MNVSGQSISAGKEQLYKKKVFCIFLISIFSHIPIISQNEDNAVSRKLHKIEVSPSFLELADGLESTVKVTF